MPILRLPQAWTRTLSNGHEPSPGRPVDAPASRTRHYAVDDFRAVRAAFGISPAAYARAFPNDLSSLYPNWREKLKESVSEGASGSFFYRVINNTAGGVSSRFIIKQITKEEKNALLSWLPAYREYVESRQGRSLIQYFGCHSMSLWWRFSGKVYFVVMRNFLPVRQWLTFDLKGATANRRALAAQLLHQIHAGEDPRSGAAWGTLRDWEWMDIAMVCDVSVSDKARLNEMITADADFLGTQGLLDYSLLVGIHRLTPQALPAEREAKLQELSSIGGFISLDRQRVYFFGIIDVLEKYSLRWRAQHAALTAGYRLSCKHAAADGISAMPPQEYADRFRTFVAREVLSLEGEQRQRSRANTGAGLVAMAPLGIATESPDAGTSCICRSCCFCCLGRRQGGGDDGDRQCCIGRQRPVSGGARWAQLWDRRRRGLIRERIEAERADHMRRIADLESQLLDSQLARATADPDPREHGSPKEAAGPRL